MKDGPAMDWAQWHAGYDVPGSKLSRRLRIVQEQIRAAFDAMPAGPRTAISLCAGQGRDIIEVLTDHPRRADVRARLVELDPRNVAMARAAAASAGLTQVEIVAGDAGLIEHYLPMTPADVVVVCGVFGNLTEPDVERTVDACGALCARDGTVIWTRHRGEPDRVPAVCHRFEQRGFERLFLTPPALGFSVGAHRHRRAPAPPPPDPRLFTFVGSDVLQAMIDP
jgi:hypothetical protein